MKELLTLILKGPGLSEKESPPSHLGSANVRMGSAYAASFPNGNAMSLLGRNTCHVVH